MRTADRRASSGAHAAGSWLRAQCRRQAWDRSRGQIDSDPAGGLQPGSDPSVLPGPVLIGDRDNNRLVEVSPDGRVLWRFPAPGDLAPGQTFLLPDDAFFSPDGRQVIVTQED